MWPLISHFYYSLFRSRVIVVKVSIIIIVIINATATAATSGSEHKMCEVQQAGAVLLLTCRQGKMKNSSPNQQLADVLINVWWTVCQHSWPANSQQSADKWQRVVAPFIKCLSSDREKKASVIKNNLFNLSFISRADSGFRRVGPKEYKPRLLKFNDEVPLLAIIIIRL